MTGVYEYMCDRCVCVCVMGVCVRGVSVCVCERCVCVRGVCVCVCVCVCMRCVSVNTQWWLTLGNSLIRGEGVSVALKAGS